MLWRKKEVKPTRRKKLEYTYDEENFNRDDHWFREFSVRSESWPMIEHWVRENDFHLAAFKGKRRLYYRGNNPSGYIEFVEFKHEENRVMIAGWIAVGRLYRWLSLFMLPDELPVEPFGFWGIRTRRRFIRDLNGFLFRFRQRPIIDSDGFHWADLDFSTTTLLVSLTLIFAFAVAALIPQLEITPALSSTLIETYGKRVGIILGVGTLFGVLHHFAVIRKFAATWAKYTSVLLFFASFTALTLVLLTYTKAEMAERKFSHHCVLHYDPSGCTEALAGLPEDTKKAIQERMEIVRAELAPKIPKK